MIMVMSEHCLRVSTTSNAEIKYTQLISYITYYTYFSILILVTKLGIKYSQLIGYITYYIYFSILILVTKLMKRSIIMSMMCMMLYFSYQY